MCPKEGTHFLKPWSLWSVIKYVGQIRDASQEVPAAAVAAF